MSFGTNFVGESDTEIVSLFCLMSFKCLEPGIREQSPLLVSFTVQTVLCSLYDLFFGLLFTQVQSSCVTATSGAVQPSRCRLTAAEYREMSAFSLSKLGSKAAEGLDLTTAAPH